MTWEPILIAMVAFAGGWHLREILDFKIRADRYSREIEAEVFEDEPEYQERIES